MSKKGGKINNQAEFLCSTSLLLQNLANKSGGVKKRLPFVLFEHHIRGKRGSAVFYQQTSDRMQFCTIFQDKLHSLNIQDDRSTRFLCTTNNGIDHVVKRFHKENSIMSGLFSQNNPLLCGMQGNNGLLARTFQTFPKSSIQYTASRFSPLTREKFAVRAVVFE